MSGKRLLDALQLLNVAKSVAGKHLEVRQRQLDIYARTSSLTKGAKNQVDGLVLTAQAAAALANRFDGDTTRRTTTTDTAPASKSSNVQANKQNKTEEALDTENPAPLRTSHSNDTAPSDETSGLARPAAGERAYDDLGRPPAHTNDVPHEKSKSSEDQNIPEDVMQGIFRSPRVASVLSGKTPYSSPKPSNFRSGIAPGKSPSISLAEASSKAAAEANTTNNIEQLADVTSAVPEVGRN